MVTASGVRIGWGDLPARVRHAVTDTLGGEVVDAVSQSGGFSPGTADRVRTARGRRAFVKAVSPAQNEHSPNMLRRESQVTAALPPEAPTPAVLGTYDDGDWVALVLTDVEGRHPDTPWRPDQLASVLAALDELTRIPPPAGTPTARDYLESDFTGWHRIRADPPSTLDGWTAANLDDLCRLAERGIVALAGDTLVHADIRADNLLIDPHGTVTVVDWPHACRGPAWLDTLMLLFNVRLHGGRPDLVTVEADRGDLVGVLAGLGGFFADAARHPPPVGLPSLREFQQAQADVVVSWLREISG
ncbi:aminoglycoside phosphotransferase family protein [Actinophytocola sp.]|uniref:aminoglycoside phosphotransferase family protein n=1 Tax=Actinophytocola sp. TaxID=1872138 RepID=UPI002ED43442